jgi:opacity protein-like surface antigen
VKRLLLLAVLFGSTPVWAQPIEVAGFVSYTTAASLDQTADGVDDLTIDGGWSWGARGTYFLTERFGVEGMWSYQETAQLITSGTNTAELFEMTINQVHGHAVYQLGPATSRLRPFVFGGLGATFFAADDLESETKMSWDLGAGVKWFAFDRLGVEGRFRYRPTLLGADDEELCGPFGFCQGTLSQVDVSVGAVFRF